MITKEVVLKLPKNYVRVLRSIYKVAEESASQAMESFQSEKSSHLKINVHQELHN
jgi:hypothetical protein